MPKATKQETLVSDEYAKGLKILEREENENFREWKKTVKRKPSNLIGL